MKQAWFVMILCTAVTSSCCAAVFFQGEVLPGEVSVLHEFQLWVADPSHWEAFFEGSTDLCHRLDGGSWVSSGQGVVTSRAGQVLRWDIGVNPGWSSPGSYVYQGQFHLEGTSGLVWYEDDGLCLLALNSEDFVVRGSDEIVELEPDQWYRFAEPVEVRWAGEAVPVRNYGDTMVQPLSYMEPMPMEWLPRSLAVLGGDVAQITLRLQGPTSGGTIQIILPPELVLHGTWETWDDAAYRCQNGIWYFDIPPLAAGEELDIVGSVKALLPQIETMTQIQAFSWGKKVELPISISRGWFAQESLLILDVRDGGKPASHVEFMLPGGRKVITDSSGLVEISLAPGLYPLVCLQGRVKPVWVVVQPEASTRLQIDLQNELASPPWLVSSLVVASSGEHYGSIIGPGLRIESDDGMIKGEIQGNGWVARLEHDTLTLRPRVDTQAYLDGDWIWRGTDQGWHGVYRKGSIGIGLDVPFAERPQAQVRIAQARFYGVLSPQAVKVGYSDRILGVGLDLKRSLGWIDLKAQQLKFSGSPRELVLEKRHSEGTFKLNVRPELLHLDITQEGLEAFVSIDSSSGMEWGVKGELGKPWSWALRLTAEGFLGEMRCSLVRELTDQLTVLGQGSVQFQPEKITSYYGIGLKVEPIPNLALLLTYDSIDGLKWQGGLMLSL